MLVLWRSLGECSRFQISMKVAYYSMNFYCIITIITTIRASLNRYNASSVNLWRGPCASLWAFWCAFSASFGPFDHKAMSFSPHLGTNLYTFPVTALFGCLALDKKSQTMCSWKLERGGKLLRLVGAVNCWGLGGRRALPGRALHSRSLR
jgi:hypothetical protein